MDIGFGQRVRLTEKISAGHRLVQEAEGTVVHIVLDPEECDEAVSGEVALKYCPLGIWVCFGDCKDAPILQASFVIRSMPLPASSSGA